LGLWKQEIEIPTLLCSLLPSLDDLEHFFFGNTPNFWQRHREFSYLFIPLVLYYIEVSKRTPNRVIGGGEFNVLALLKAFAFVGLDLSRRY
jgi:hypothetical protein